MEEWPLGEREGTGPGRDSRTIPRWSMLAVDSDAWGKGRAGTLYEGHVGEVA